MAEEEKEPQTEEEQAEQGEVQTEEPGVAEALNEQRGEEKKVKATAGDDKEKTEDGSEEEKKEEHTEEQEKTENDEEKEEGKEENEGEENDTEWEEELLGKEEKKEPEKPTEPKEEAVEVKTKIFALRTTANREDQVLEFLASHIEKKGLDVYSVIRPHGTRGYIFVEAKDKITAEQAIQGIPYARGILPKPVEYKEIEHMLEQVKREIDIRKNDVVEIISGPFKGEKAKVTRVDKVKEEVVIELLEAAVPIPMTRNIDNVKVIRREKEEEPEA